MTARNRTAGVSGASGIGPNCALEGVRSDFPPTQPLSSPECTQMLVLEDFPDPTLARQLSPNGRVHWAVRAKARKVVAEALHVTAMQAGWQPVTVPVRMVFRFVRPTRGRIDIDNLSTGVTKAVLDSLVRGGWLADDDSRHVVAVTAEAAYERGRRALEIRMEAA